MCPIKCLSFCLSVLTLSWTTSLSVAQEAKATDTSKSPIYLEEPGQDPPARVARRKTVKQNYDDDKPRSERNVAMLSDDRIVNDGKFVEYYRNGSKYVEGNYKMGVFEGAWQYWFENGQLCKKVSFKDGKPHGQWDVFDPEGNLTAKKSYQHGKRHGHWITYYAGGEKPRFEIHYEQGVPSGERIAYFENGQKRQSVSFKEGKMHGMMTEWNENGEKRAEVKFEDGKIAGQVERFDK